MVSLFLDENSESFSLNNSLHAGVSTFEHGVRQAIPHSAFVDAVNDYQEADSETDDEGSIHGWWFVGWVELESQFWFKF